VTLTLRGKIVTVLGIVVGLIGASALAGVLWLRSLGVLGSSDPGRVVEVEVPEGASASEIGELLADAGVVKSALGFRIRAWMEGGAGNIQAGSYELHTGLTARDALTVMVASGPLVEFTTVTFPEGSWLTDFARIVGDETHISRGAFLQIVRKAQVGSSYLPDDVDTLEGLLFPSTYQVIDKDDARTLATRLVEEFERQMERIDLSRVRTMGYAPYEAITIASMIEAEARVTEDRPKIAAVIYNRLDEGMRLDIDATVLYALGEHKAELTSEDLAIDSPYNTRLYAGLPPTPIGAPGMGSLEAAGAPADGAWLYYVLADCEGHHAFSETYEQFLADKAAYQALDC
jgi:UPF0755 protein